MNLGNTPFAPLTAHLFDLLTALDGQDIPLILVGGFGLFLRRQYVLESGERRLLEYLPNARATEDFDVVMRLQVLANLGKMTILRQTLNRMGYQFVKGAEKYQFFKPDSSSTTARNVKIDLLARKPGEGDPELHHDSRRVQPIAKNSPLHARTTSEAIAVEDGLLLLTLEDTHSDGSAATGTVFLPHTYALYLMKLFALSDEHNSKKGPGRENYAQKHASDLFTLTALLTASENDRLVEFRQRYGASEEAKQAGTIVKSLLGTINAPGALYMRQQLVGLPMDDLATCIEVLTETFPATDETES
jgi:hypothetical protein